MLREWTSNRWLAISDRWKSGAIIVAVLVLSALAGSGRLPVEEQFLLPGIAGISVLLFAIRRMELGLMAVFVSFLLGLSVFSIGSLNLGVTVPLVVALVGLGALRNLTTREWLFSAPGMRLIFSWLVVAALSVLYSYIAWDPRVRGEGKDWADGHRWIGYQLGALGGIIIPALIYALAANGIRQRRWFFILWGVAGVILLYLAVPGIWEYLQRPVLPWAAPKPASGGAGIPGMYLAALALGMFFGDRHPTRRLLLLALYGLGALGVFASYALSAWLGLFGGTLVIVWQHSRRVRVAAVAALIAAGVLALPVLELVYLQRVNSSDMLRLTIWDTALDIWQISPVIGIGAGNLPSYMVAFSPLESSWVSGGGLSYAHNVYLTILAENGFIGLGCAVGFIVVFLRAVWTRRGKMNDALLRGIVDGGFAVFIGSMITGSVGTGLFYVSSDAMFQISGAAFTWTLFGVAVAAERLDTDVPSQGS